MILKSQWFSRFIGGAMAAVAVTSSVYAGGTTVSSKKAVTPVEEQEAWWSATLSAGYDSKYIFRGFFITNENGGEVGDLVSTDLSFSAYNFTLGAWYAASWGDDFTELDIYGSYTYEFGETGLAFTVGGIGYFFPDFDDTWELFAGLSYSPVDWLTASLTYTYDFEVFEGSYIEFKLASSIPLIADVLSLDPYALVSFGDYNTFGEDFELNHVQGGVALVWAMSENITLSGYVAVSEPLDALDDSQDTEVWGGGRIAFSF